MVRPMTRIDPALPVGAMQTYQITAPPETHWRPATCAEVECPHYLGGWRVRVEGLPPEVLHTARNSGRRFVEQSIGEGETWLVYEAGQPCFKASQHRVRTARPELYIVRGGDWRANTGLIRQHSRPEDWVDDFATNQDKLARQREKG